MYEVQLDQFSGPMEKLLELIEEQKLEITQVSLAAVTGDFIKFVESLGEKVDSNILADFVVVASRLLLIKSKTLLPSLELTDEEQGDIVDLELRLRLYQEYKLASVHIQKLWTENNIAYSRPLLSSLGENSFFYPPKGVDVRKMESAMNSLFTVLQGLLPETKKIKITVVTLQEKIAELTTRLSEAAEHNFKGLAGAKSRNEVIVLFLAVLHMLANRLMHAEQGDTFGDIKLKRPSERPTDGNGDFALGILSAQE
ncbi:MAG: segregation/condensation protein A [bacterium]|nr:segregation/condensation protein A [bacterium]